MACLTLFISSLTYVTQITARTWEVLLNTIARLGGTIGLRGEDAEKK